MDQLILLANASKYAFNIDKKSQFNQTVRFLKHCASLKIIYMQYKLLNGLNWN